MKWAVYDLRWNPPGYDFLQFLQRLPEEIGGIRFKPGSTQDHGTEEDEKRKLEKIAFRICANFGLQYIVSEQSVGEETFPPKPINAHAFRHIRLLKKPNPLMPSQEVLEKVKEDLQGRKIVVILRESPIQPLRNSGPDWRRWAQDHNACVLEDAQKTDMTPEEFAAYSELADVTMGVFSGPLTAAMYSENRPYIAFRCITEQYRALSIEKWERWGWKVGEQMPWAGEHQRMIWSYADDYETLEREYSKHLRSIR